MNYRIDHGWTITALIVSLMSLPASAQAVERFVCDMNQLEDAIAAAKPGDEIVMCNGDWRDAHIELDVDGTVSDPIRLRAETPGQVRLLGSSDMRLGGSYAVVDGLVFTGRYTGPDGNRVIQFRIGLGRECNHCRVTNLAFIDYNNNENEQLKWITLFGQYNRVDHSYFSGKSNRGAMVQVLRQTNDPDYHRIDHNFFSRPTMDFPNGGEAVQVGVSGRLADADSATTVDNNYFFRADGDPEIISNKSSGNVYRHNTFVESQGALTLRQGHRVTIDGNYFFGGGVALTSGVTILGDSHTIINNYFFNLNPTNYHRLGGIVMGTADDKIDPQKGWYDLPRVRNVLIAHNTILGTEQSLLYKESRDNGFGNVKPTGVRIINNIISAPGKDLIEDRINLADVEYAGNVFDGNVDSAVSSGGNITRNPRLQESGDSVFRPGSDSPAIDAAVELSTVTHDIDDQRRRGSSDIGADEFSNGGSMRAPIGLCDVGPTSFRPGLKAACTNTATRPAPPQFLTIS